MLEPGRDSVALSAAISAHSSCKRFNLRRNIDPTSAEHAPMIAERYVRREVLAIPGLQQTQLAELLHAVPA